MVSNPPHPPPLHPPPRFPPTPQPRRGRGATITGRVVMGIGAAIVVLALVMWLFLMVMGAVLFNDTGEPVGDLALLYAKWSAPVGGAGLFVGLVGLVLMAIGTRRRTG